MNTCTTGQAAFMNHLSRLLALPWPGLLDRTGLLNTKRKDAACLRFRTEKSILNKSAYYLASWISVGADYRMIYDTEAAANDEN